MIQSGAIEQCEFSEGQFLSSYFLVSKPDGSFRFILNLKKLNLFVKTEHFKIEDIRTAINILCKNDLMCKIDLKDAYFLVPVHESHKKFLRFEFNGQLYQFTVLPFGLSTSPYVFTKILKPVINILRLKGYRSTIYLDDICLFGESKTMCLNNTKETMNLLTSLGFIINFEKSNIVPKKICQFLGFVIDSSKMLLMLTDKKRFKIYGKITDFLSKKQCKIRDLAEVIGILVAACPAIRYGWLYYKELEINKYLALKKHHKDFNKHITLSRAAIQDLNWWKNHILFETNTIRTFTFMKEIFSDASTSGWGGVCEGNKVHGFWNSEERKLHINQLEILAAFLALKCFAFDEFNCQILLRIDNTTAIAYLNKMGGIKFPHLNRLAKEVWEWCIERKLWIFAEYVATKENIADEESRISNIDTEWELAHYAFRKIIKRFGNPEIDFFAKRNNKKCSKYCSWERDPDAFVINAFTINWENLFGYAFPPFSLIPKILKKIRSDKAICIVIVPLWTAQPWFPEFNRLLISEKIEFRPSNNLLLSPCRTITHPLATQLPLIAGVLSGRHTREEDSRTQQWI